jgi:hypothetical protein
VIENKYTGMVNKRKAEDDGYKDTKLFTFTEGRSLPMRLEVTTVDMIS